MARKKQVVDKNTHDTLLKIMWGTPGTVTYTYPDGSIQYNPINPIVFKSEKGSNLSTQSVYKLFLDTKHDRGALDFSITI